MPCNVPVLTGISTGIISGEGGGRMGAGENRLVHMWVLTQTVAQGVTDPLEARSELINRDGSVKLCVGTLEVWRWAATWSGEEMLSEQH